MTLLWLLTCVAITRAAYGCGVPAIKPVTSGFGCGVPAIKPFISGHARIVNGQNAVSGSWPWQVSLQNRTGFHYCGGSLIKPNWIISAAHCPVRTFHVAVLGMYDRASTSEARHVKKISKVIIHPLYNNETGAHDVLLVKLSTPVVYDDRVSPVCLNASSDDFSAGFKCVTSGWGCINGSTEESPTKLQQVSLPLISNHECQTFLDVNISGTMICAGAAGATSCMGDSGGPLVCHKNGIWTLLGIVSRGHFNCSTSFPTLCTSVLKVQAWVNQIIASN
ncbi:chymotrypsinogen 2-like [Ascaphus truei]|uniref:chymotrypsinogen 2-like n=1 Tax=Ascaphus truei TaxID=8439 RepID=UPI003F592C27